MKAIDDGPLQDTPELGSDLSTYFELVWRHLDAREKRAGNDNSARHKVRLECSGDLIDAESIGVVVTRGPEAGAEEFVEFLCPQCDRLHESPRFR